MDDVTLTDNAEVPKMGWLKPKQSEKATMSVASSLHSI